MKGGNNDLESSKKQRTDPVEGGGGGWGGRGEGTGKVKGHRRVWKEVRYWFLYVPRAKNSVWHIVNNKVQSDFLAHARVKREKGSLMDLIFFINCFQLKASK